MNFSECLSQNTVSKEKLNHLGLKITPFLVTPFHEAKSFSRAQWILWMPGKLHFPSTICCAFLFHFGVQSVRLSAAGSAKHIYTILQGWSLCTNIANIKPMISARSEAGVFSNQQKKINQGLDFGSTHHTDVHGLEIFKSTLMSLQKIQLFDDNWAFLLVNFTCK